MSSLFVLRSKSAWWIICVWKKKTLFFLHLRQILSWTALHVIMVMLCKGKKYGVFVESTFQIQHGRSECKAPSIWTFIERNGIEIRENEHYNQDKYIFGCFTILGEVSFFIWTFLSCELTVNLHWFDHFHFSNSRWVQNQEEGTIMLEATTLVPPTLCLTAGSEMIAVDIFSTATVLVVITV